MSVDLGTARAKILLDTSQLAAGVSAASGQFARLEGSTRGLSSSLTAISTTMGRIGGAIAVGVGAAVKSFASFEQQINTLGAVSGATEDQLAQLADLAKQIGQETSVGATEAAQGLTELVKAGIDTEDVLAGAGEAAVALAEAGGVGVARAAEVMANALNIFNLEGKDAARVADVFAAAANKSAADVDDLAQAMAQVGTVAHQFGLSIEDTAGALALFADAGLKGSDAGTSLKTALTAMLAPVGTGAAKLRELGLTFRDANGEFVGLATSADQLRAALEPLSQAQRDAALSAIFGQDAIRVGAILYQEGGAAVREYTTAVNDAGAAHEVAAARMAGLSGALEQMRGSIETAAIAFGEALAPAIIVAAGGVERAADAFGNLAPAIQQTIAVTVALGGAMLLTGAALIRIAATVSKLVGALGTIVGWLARARGGMLALSLATGPVGRAIAIVAAALGPLVVDHLRAAAAAREHAKALRELDDAFVTFSKFVAELRIQGLEDAALAAESFARTTQNTIHYLDEQKRRMNAGEAVMGALADAWARGEVGAEELQRSIEAVSAALPEMEDALKDTRLDTVALAGDFKLLVEQLARGAIEPEQFTAQIEEILTHLDRYKKAAEAIPDPPIPPLAPVIEGDIEALERFAEQLAETTAEALATVAGIEDIAPAIDGMQAGFGRAGDSLATLITRLAEAGRIDLTDLQHEALQAQRALERLEAQGVALDEAIANNRDDLAMWAGRIGFVTDVLGGNTEQLDEWLTKLQEGEITQEQFNAAVADPSFIASFDKLDALYESGAISQENYNKAKAAGVRILQRSAGGIQDENEELVANLLALDAYIGKHDDAHGAVEGLTDAQRGFLAAMQDSASQTALQTLNLLAYLAAAGLIPPEKVTEFIADVSQADPVVKALFDDLGLLPEEKTTTLTVTGDGTELPKELLDTMAALPAEKRVALQVELTGAAFEAGFAGIPGVGDVAALQIPTELQAPGSSDVPGEPAEEAVPTKLAPPDDSAVTGYVPEPIVIPTELGPPDDSAVTGYVPEPVIIPTQFGAPTGAGSEGVAVTGPSAVTIPTELGPPDDTAVTSYVPPTVTIPVEFGALGSASVGDQATVTIPTAFGPPDDSAIVAPTLPVVIPTVYALPVWPEGATIQRPNAIEIPTELEAPDTAAIDDYAPPTIVVPISALSEGFESAISRVRDDADEFAAATYAATLDAEPAEFDTALDGVQADGDTFDGTTYTAILAADATDAANDLATVIGMANAFARTYTATLTADISGVETAVQQVANLLPSSPAKEGPLAKDPSFDYVVDAFVAAMREIASLGKAAAVDLGPLVRQSFATSEFAVVARGGGLATAPGGGGFVDARQFFALKSDEFRRLLSEAERGGAAHDWIARRETAYATVGG